MVWDARTLEPSATLRWIECHPAFAAYLQAAGVILAVAGSALFTRWSISPALDERKARASVVVYRLLPPIIQIRSTAKRVRKAFGDTENGGMLAASDHLDKAVYYFTIDAAIPSDILSELHVLPGPLAEDIAQLHFFLTRFNDFVRFNVPQLRQFDGKQRAWFESTFITYLDAVDDLSDESKTLLEAQPSTQK